MQGCETVSATTTIAASSPTSAKKLRVLLLCSHPTQYSAPMWRRMARHPQLDILVAYCSLQGAEAELDPGFGIKVAWDVPVLNDYRWVQMKNVSFRPRVGAFLGLVNPGVWKLIRGKEFDAVAIFTGYMCVTFWIALLAAKISGLPVAYGTDATTLHSVDGRRWKTQVKKYLWPRLFGMADAVLVPSSGTAELMRSLNIPEERIALTPYVVDNDWWTENASRVDRKAVRKSWGIPEDASVVLFCAKLQPWKRPQDVLRAFVRAEVPNSYLMYAGDGALRQKLEREARDLQVTERVRFLGFVNQSGLPRVYCSSDIMVLPSEYEPFGVVVNEAMLCGCPVIVSDRVGARFDLVRENQTGFVYPAGDLGALAAVLNRALQSRERLALMGEVARQRMAEWSPETNLEAMAETVARAIRLKHS